jgi:hypothetical protein
MRTIKQTSQFKRDLKREAKCPHRVVLAQDFTEIVRALARGAKGSGAKAGAKGSDPFLTGPLFNRQAPKPCTHCEQRGLTPFRRDPF